MWVVSSLITHSHVWWCKRNKWSWNPCWWRSHCHWIYNVACNANSWVLTECLYLLWSKSSPNSVGLGARGSDYWNLYYLRWKLTIVYKQRKRSWTCPNLISCDCSYYRNWICSNLRRRASLPNDNSRAGSECNERCSCNSCWWTHSHRISNVCLSADRWVFCKWIDSQRGLSGC